MLSVPIMRGLTASLVGVAAGSAAGGVAAEPASRAANGHIAPSPDPTAVPVVSVGIGGENFLGNVLRSTVGAGPSWNVRAAMGSLADVRVELVYAGSAQPFRDSAMAGAWLVAHGILGLLRVNVAPGHAFEPFFYIGGGWDRFHVTGRAGAGLRTPDHVLEIPFGLGVARRFGRLVVDACAGLSIMNGADLISEEDSTSSDGENMHRAGVRVNLGLTL
jgi:hypothetical protein